MKKRFECGHVGKGKYCHRCEQETKTHENKKQNLLRNKEEEELCKEFIRRVKRAIYMANEQEYDDISPGAPMKAIYMEAYHVVVFKRRSSKNVPHPMVVQTQFSKKVFEDSCRELMKKGYYL